MKSQNNRTAIILAGGKSTRMGYNKEKIIINGDYLVYQQIDLLKTLFDQVIVITKDIDFYKDKDVLACTDILESNSPLAGLHAGLSHSTSEYNYLIACDMPNLNIEFINETSKSINDHSAYIVQSNGYYEPFNSFYNKSITSQIELFLKHNRKFQDFIDSLENIKVIDLSPSMSALMFQNLNTVEDLSTFTKSYQTYEEFKILKYNDEAVKTEIDSVINEYPLTLVVNKEKLVTLLITPKNIEELILGYLKSEKIIENISDIISIVIDEEHFKANIMLKHEIDFSSINKELLLTSGCGVGTKFHEDVDQILLDSIKSNLTISYDDIMNASRELNNKSGLFKATGGVHSCLYFYGNESIYFEDIGRHNAVDKVVGYILKKDVDTSSSYIISSGRISSDMLLKCAVSGIPIILSRSAPTSLTVKLGEKLGITVVGFVRGNRFNVYTNSHRIVR